MAESRPAHLWEGTVSHQLLEDKRVHLFRRSVLGFEVASVLLLSERFNLVIDTLCSPGDMLPVHMAALTSGRSRPILVVNTHADWDHVWGNATFAGQPIIAHRRCQERLRLNGQREINEIRCQNPGCPPITLHLPDITFDGTMTISGSDLTFHLMSVAGHTDDSIAVHIPELDLLVAGDTVEYPLPRLSQVGLTQQYIRELYRLSALKPRTVIPSHGPVVNGSDLIQANAAYLRGLVQKVRAGYLANASLSQLEQEIDPAALLPTGYDLDFEPGVRPAHIDNIRYVYQELEGKV